MTIDKFIDLNGRKIYAKVIGDGEPIVFLHGGPGSEHRFFLPHVLPLAGNFTLVLYDQRGCGRSESSANNQYSMEEEVKTLESLRTELNLEKINLFGESWGSMLALLYASIYPARVNKVLLTAAIGATSEGFKTFQSKLFRRLSFIDKFKIFKVDRATRRGSGSFDDILDILDPYYVFSKDTLAAKTSYRMNATVNRLISDDISKNYDLSEGFERLSGIPILVLQGSDDILSPRDIDRLLIQYIPHARLYEIEDCGHWSVIEKPEEINFIAQEFFASSC